MKVLIIYYSQSGNTMRIAKSIAKGCRAAGAETDVIKLKEAKYEMLDGYDMIGLGSPVWKVATPNMHHFITQMPDQHGKHCFLFNTHGTLPHLYFPVTLPNAKRVGLLPIGYKDWYGDVTMPGMPKPYYTYGHPDEQDFAEAEAFGREMVENSPRIAAGETGLIYPDPVLDDKVMTQALICSNMLAEPVNPQGDFIRDPKKCAYPACHLCMDNCPMEYIDLAADPQRFGNRGFKCDDCHECSFCFMICPTGAIEMDPPAIEHALKNKGKRHEAFEEMLRRDEAEGKFRPHIAIEDVGVDTPYLLWHPKRPYFVIPKDEQDK